MKNHTVPIIDAHTQVRKKTIAAIGKGGKPMWGFSLEFWEHVFFGATWLAAIAGGISVTCAAVAGIVGYQVTDRLLKTADVRIAEANSRAEDAHARVAESEKEVAIARLETEKIKAAVTWRQISAESASEMITVLSAKPSAVNLRHVDGDPESHSLALKISDIFGRAGWQVALGANRSGPLLFGIAILEPAGLGGRTVSAAFAAAKMPLGRVSTNAKGNFSGLEINGAPTIFVGSKPVLP